MSDLGSGPELIRLLGGWLAATDITLLELRTPAESIRLSRTEGETAVAQAAAPPASDMSVVSPGAGQFLDRHPLRAEPLAAPGQAVRAGDVVGLLQVGSLLLHVTAPADGVVAEALAAAGSTVGFGTVLLRLQTKPRDVG